MATKYSKEDLAKMSSESKDLLIISMQDQLEKLNENIENLKEAATAFGFFIIPVLL